MPTVALDAWRGFYQEQPDRIEPFEPWLTNRHGQRSWTARPSDGRWGCALQGVMYQVEPRTLLWGFSAYAGDSEGPYAKTAFLVFKDLGIPRGATVTDARFTNTWTTQQASNEKTYRLFADLEPYPLVRLLGDFRAYSAVDQVGHWAQFGYARRWRTNSHSTHHRHTQNYVEIVGRPDQTGTIPPFQNVIQEVVAQPDWSPNNPIVLALTGAAGAVPFSWLDVPYNGAQFDVPAGEAIQLSVTWQ